jgi:hypothetical protein
VKNETFYIHSRCCNSHWELVVSDGVYKLQCEKCGKDSGVGIIPPMVGPCECEICKKGEDCGSHKEENNQ